MGKYLLELMIIISHLIVMNFGDRIVICGVLYIFVSVLVLVITL